MLDHYVYGKVHRLSPEAPIPILLNEEEKYFLGGAGNVARNLSEIGAKCTLLSLIGTDHASKKIKNLVSKDKNIKSELLKIDTSIDEFFYSPFHPDIKNDKYKKFKNLRKPNIGMLENAVKKWPVNIKDSLLIGDKASDIECANNFGIKGFLYKEGNLLNFVKEVII